MEKILINVEEAAELMGLSKSTIYKLTSQRKISFYKPFGKRIFFSKEHLEEMMKQNLMKTRTVLENEAVELLKQKN